MNPSTPSAVLAAGTTTVIAKPVLLCNIMLHPGSAASSVTIYDNASAGSGTVLAVLQGVASGATVIFPFDDSPPMAKNGITCVVAGTGAQAQVYYQPL
jgi:hypothetical protein